MLARYFADIRRSPLLDAEEERRLGLAARAGDAQAVNRLVEANLRFVVKIAKDYRNRGLGFEDLVAEGNLGLIDAARRFDPDRGTRFTNWAVWSIRKAMLAALTEQGAVVRLPASQLVRMREVRTVERALRESLGREPSNEELASRLPRRLAGLDPVHRHGLRVSSLDEPVAEGSEMTLDETLEDRDRPSAEQTLLQREALEQARAAFDELESGQRTILAHRLGIDDCRPLTLTELGQCIGLTHEGVRKIELRAKLRLRRTFQRRVYGRPAVA